MDELEKIGCLDSYDDAVRIMMRILAINEYELAQKRFAGLVTEDAASIDFELSYKIDTLWTYKCEGISRRHISSLKWCPHNFCLLAVGYRSPLDSCDVGF